MAKRQKSSPKNDPAAQQYELARAGDLQRHPRNPNQGDGEAIGESIEENGFYGACVVQRSTGHILIGNHRWERVVASEGPEARIPVIWIDVDDKRALKIMMADNATRQGAKTNVSMVTELLRGLGADTRGTGYKPPQVEELLKAARPKLDYLEQMRGEREAAASDGGDEPPFDAEDEDRETPPPPSAPEVPRHALPIVLTNAEKRVWDRLKTKVGKKKDKDAFLTMMSKIDVDG